MTYSVVLSGVASVIFDEPGQAQFSSVAENSLTTNESKGTWSKPKDPLWKSS